MSRKRRNIKEPVHVCDVLKNSFKRLGFEKRIKEFEVMNLWGKVVGEGISRSSMPAGIIGKRLYVTVSASVWMEELKYHKMDIINRINQTLGKDYVSEIIFKVGKIDSINPCSLITEAFKKTRTLTSEEEAKIDRLTSILKDDELKGIISNIIAKQRMFLE